VWIVMLPAIMLIAAVEEVVRHAIAHPDQPCEKLLSEGEIGELTGGRVRTAEVSVTPGRCVADYGAAEVTLARDRLAGDELERLRRERGFMSDEQTIEDHAWLVEARQLVGGDREITQTVLAPRAGGFVAVRLKYVGDAKEEREFRTRALPLVRARLARADAFFVDDKK
jgi:hypothetical protein